MAKRKRKETFAAKLRALREEAGSSQYRLAKLTGLSDQTMSRLELGTQPSWRTVQLIAKALDQPFEAFVVEPRVLEWLAAKDSRPAEGGEL
jgi:transcriptional regulator with XRE-family HTH domain